MEPQSLIVWKREESSKHFLRIAEQCSPITRGMVILYTHWSMKCLSPSPALFTFYSRLVCRKGINPNEWVCLIFSQFAVWPLKSSNAGAEQQVLHAYNVILP